MPFTLSHPAAIVPLYKWSKRQLPLAALVIGALTPDAAYFIPLPRSEDSHSLAGLVLFCWPVGLALWLVFEFLLKQPTLDLMPDALRARIAGERTAITGRALLYVSIALMLGALTHIVWDSFTHATSPVVAGIPFLQVPIASVNNEPLPLYKCLQHASSVVGLLAIVWTALRWWRCGAARNLNSNSPVAAPNALPNSFRIAAISGIALASLLGAITNHIWHPHGSLERQIFFMCIGGISAFVLAWCAAAILARCVNLRKRSRKPA